MSIWKLLIFRSCEYHIEILMLIMVDDLANKHAQKFLSIFPVILPPSHSHFLTRTYHPPGD